MSILSLNNLGQAYGDYDVFLGLTATVPNNGRVGLVGPNGVGKTTLLRILAGLDEPTSGSINAARETRIGYLRQEAMDAFAGRDNTIYEEMLTVFGDVQAQEAHLQQLQERMAQGDTDAVLLREYSRANEAFELAGGYEYEVRISQVLDGLGFGREDWETPLSILSGGQKTRALLARLLLESPDLLIMDEPTNHLDVEAIEWLESTLRTWPGALLIVSHDRYFLDAAVTHIWEMSRGGMEEYRGNYSAYVVQREERWARRQSEFDSMQQTFLKELDYIKRNIARDSTKDQAVGRMKRLVRQVKAVQIGGVQILLGNKWSEVAAQIRIPGSSWSVMELESNIKGLERPNDYQHRLAMRFNTQKRSGELVLRTDGVTIGYPASEDDPGAELFRTDKFTLHRLECAALIGPNGTGKSTFLKTLMGQIEPLDGRLRLGASLKVGYFAQSQERFNPDNNVLEELLTHKHMLMGEARSHLARFLFRQEDVFKPVRTLSGGERGRLALSILALEGANFLLLDEPTNHLDIPAQEVLQSVIENFDGTVLLVSHDRYLVDQLATQVWDLRDGKMTVFEGTYAELMARKAQDAGTVNQVVEKKKTLSREEQREQRRQQNAARKRQQEADAMEQRVHEMEQELEEIAQTLQAASDAQDLEKIQRISERYAKKQEELEQAMERWAALAEAV